MKKGFTMIELIFVIVILGILAAVAIPRLAATRDDATLAGIKTDVSSAMQAVPAWFQGQRDVRISEAMQLDTTKWAKGNAGEEYVWSADDGACVTLAIHDMNRSDAGVWTDHALATTADDYNITSGRWRSTAQGVPVLRIIKTDGADGDAGSLCSTLWDDMGLSEANITLAGRRVQW